LNDRFDWLGTFLHPAVRLGPRGEPVVHAGLAVQFALLGEGWQRLNSNQKHRKMMQHCCCCFSSELIDELGNMQLFTC
jgi:hypothetical protein